VRNSLVALLEALYAKKKNAPQARPISQNAPQARFFDQVPMGTLSY